MRGQFSEEVKRAQQRFPSIFDKRLLYGLDRLIANVPANFISLRSYQHLKTVLLAQFFLQLKIEKRLQQPHVGQKPLFLKLFRNSSRICCALSCHFSHAFTREQLLNTFHSLLPGIQDIPHSFFMWHHPDLSYQFFYIELEKLRGKSPSVKELRVVEKSLREQLQAAPPLTPSLFWPYNEEESFRQVQLMHREMQNPGELPHISILFQEQTLMSLEFLVHYVRPQATTALEDILKKLPSFFDVFLRFKKQVSLPFSIEMGAFSLKVPSSIFDVRGSINLLYARRYIAKYLEMIFGPFRDYNGGLFEKQQYHFEAIRVNLGDKIPLFDLFAEKVFYAIHPIEARLAISLSEAEKLLCAFSEIIQSSQTYAVVQKDDHVVVLKNDKWDDYSSMQGQKIAHAHLTFGTDEYSCYLGPNVASYIPALLKKNRISQKKMKILRLSFQEGVPPSLNPHLSSGDMRCRMLSKLLFEGLMRLNAKGEPEPAGALEYHTFENGLRYIFKLRTGYWTNGEKLTATDYVASWQRALRDHVSHPEQLFVIKNAREFKEFKCDGKKLGIRALDAKTLEIELGRQDPFFLHKLAQPIFFPLFGTMREPKWFNGPYLIRSQTREGLLLERNPYFWETSPPFFEQIEIKWLDDIEIAYQLFQEEKIDWIGDPLGTLSPRLIERLQEQQLLKARQVNRRFLVHFNTRLPPLSIPHIRRALSAAIDTGSICKTIFPHCIPLPNLDNQPPEELFQEGLKKLRLTKDSFPSLAFTYSHQTGREELAQYLQTLWQQKLGITIHLEKIEWNLFRNKLEKGEFEITATIQETLENAPLEFLERFEGTNSWNFSQWKNPLFRECLNQSRETQNVSAQEKLLSKANEILAVEHPFAPLFKCTHLFAHHPKLDNYFFDAEGCIDFCHSYKEKKNE